MGNCFIKENTVQDTSIYVNEEEDVMVSHCIIDGSYDIVEKMHEGASSFYKPGSIYKPSEQQNVKNYQL